MSRFIPPAPIRTSATDSAIFFEHLVILGRHPGVGGVSYLGYPLRLSPSEYRILLCLVDALSNGDRGVGTERLLTALDSEEASETSIDATQVAVYIRRINQKAAGIGGRKLIVRDRHLGYRLNPYM